MREKRKKKEERGEEQHFCTNIAQSRSVRVAPIHAVRSPGMVYSCADSGSEVKRLP